MMRLLAIVIGSTAFWWASGDWSCVLVFVVPACAVVDWFLEPVICGLQRKKTARRNAARLIIIGVIGFVTGHLMRVTPQWAFQEALRIDAPTGVEVTHIRRHYEGGPGEHTLIVEFNADDNAFKKLLNDVPEVLEGHIARKWREAGANWDAAWTALCGIGGFPFSHWSWSRIAPLTNPLFVDYGFPRYPGGPVYPGEALILWDPLSYRGVLLQRRY